MISSKAGANHEDCVWVDFDLMEKFMADIFKGLGVPEEDAKICANVLITADKRGIDSHGINRLKPIYFDRGVPVNKSVQEEMLQMAKELGLKGHDFGF